VKEAWRSLAEGGWLGVAVGATPFSLRIVTDAADPRWGGWIMRYIDLDSWPRRQHYELYRRLDQPHFNMCANLDLTEFHAALKEQGASFTVGVLYVLGRVANDIPAFRLRMRGDVVVEHEVVNPSTTVLSDDGQFGFCTVAYNAAFQGFNASASDAIAHAKSKPSVDGDPEKDDVLFTTSIPWVSFTSFAHPMHFHPSDSVPRLAWGKRFEENGRLKMPLSVQGHHALMDGFHMGQFYEGMQDYLSSPGQFLGTKRGI
jgi:chloramphenicol O-acetyltransferase type A